MADKKVKIMRIDGLQPRPFQDFEDNIHVFSDHKNRELNSRGEVVEAFYPVYEIPEKFAKFKLAERPDRYVLVEASEPLRFPVIGASGKRDWKESVPAKWRLVTTAKLDPETGVQKKDSKGKPEIEKTNELVDILNKKIDAKPYRVVVIAPIVVTPDAAAAAASESAVDGGAKE